MWFFKRKVKRYIAFTLLIVFVQSLFAPAISNALTTGPHQPEYIAFTDPGSTDLVDLITGDFSFNLPLLDIPGPEGGFSLPLSYSAGINTDQESSWVGLGWSLNAGSITRTVNEFPDDANGELNTITVKDLTGVRGWEASLFGIGKMGWNNQAGHYGGLSILGIINAEWTEDYSSVGVAGFNVTSNGLDVDPIQLGITIATIISWGAVSSAASGAALASGATASEASAMATAAVTKAIATQAVVGVAMDGFFSMALGGGGPNAPTAGYWKYDTYKRNTFFGLGNVKEYRIWLDQTRSEQMYGTLYLGNIPTTTFSGSGTNLQVLLKNGGVTEPLYVFQNSNNSGAASDINYQAAPNQENLQFHEINNPVALAPDYYSVNAVGISGTIRPYRLDVGAVSMPRQMTKYHDRMATVKYVTNDASYKVPFIYNGQRSNVYFHHVGASSAVSSPTFYFGLNTILANSSPPSNTSITYDINDLVLKNQRIRTDLNTYKKIPQANYIEWLSNNEIRSSMTYASKFMDYFSGGTGSTVSTSSDRYQFRSTLPIGSMTAYTYTTGISPTIPINPSDMSKFSVNDVVDLNISLYANQASAESGTTSNNPTITSVVVNGVGASSITINDSRLTPYYGQYANIEIVLSKSPSVLTAMGGFCITAADGTTYHFALPTYDYDQYTEMRDVSDPNNKKSIIKRTSPFANTWVITAITGSDFVDRNSNGIVDDSDWGHWVKFNYGFHMNNYKYRFPYTDGVYKKTPASTYESFTEGKKQLLYLNSIETRSHVGLFLKSSRSDGKSANTTVSQFPLKLDEIVLVSKEHYQKMVKPTAQGGFGITDFSNKSNYVLLSANITAGLRDFLNQNCLRRVVFGYATSNSLAQGTLNSTGGGGKLTLSRLSVFGKVSKKIVPDYLFEYANNPAYGENYWDGFGMYNPSGTSAGSTHNPSTTDSDGSAWSLTKITTPLGSEINVNYERDTYYSVAGNTISEAGASFSNLNFDLYYPTYFPITKLTVNNPSSYFVVGDSVRVSGYATYYCSNNPVTQNKTFTKDARIVAVGSNYIDLGVDYMNLNCTLNTSGQYIHFDAQAGQVSAPLKNRKGGDIRVGSLVVRDEFGNENKVRYLYKNDDGTSSGVLAKLPQYVIGPYQNAQDYLNFPTTPVMYRRVTVLGGKLSNDNDFTSKYVYDFETPDQSQLSLVQSVIKQNELIGTNVLAKDYQSIYWNRYEDRTSKIGRLKSVRVYDNAGNLYSSSILSYTDQMLNNGINNYQGVYTDGAIMFDRAGNNVIEKYHKINRTTTIHYPYVLKKITNTKDGFTTVSENLSWDLYTGSELEKVIRNPVGSYVKSVNKLAYTVYPEMGSKALNPAYKNMLSQTAASYTYRSDALGNNLSLLSATAQTWNKTWGNYRVYQSGSQTFTDGTEGDAVWRTGPGYVYVGDFTKLKADGTMAFATGDQFNFSGSNPLWQYVGETKRFDHYSMPLEAKDVNNIYSATKIGYENRIPIASAANAEYNEIAFSSAEDIQTDKPFFGGEVGIGAGTILYKSKGDITQANTNDPNITTAHCGDAIVALTTGVSFVYKSSGLKTNKKYRASVWTNSSNARIYYKLNGAAEVLSSAPDAQLKSGNWYLLNLEFTTGATFTSLEIGVKSLSGKVVFDDFRFQPADAIMQCFVYDPLTFEYAGTASVAPKYEYTLDNDNLATMFEYNEQGMLKAVYRESVKPGTQYNGMKKIQESAEDYRRFYINQ